MSKLNIYTPDGVQDILFESSFMKRNIENELIGLFSSYGYRELETPTFEFSDVFNLENFSLAQESMFKIFDEKGRLLVLKPDQTIPVARVLSTKMKSMEDIKKVSYIQNTFRFDEQGGGKKREFTQAGCELVNIKSPYADAEIIALAVKSLISNGLEDFQIDIGHIEFFKGLLEETQLNTSDIEKVRKLIDVKDFLGLEEMLEQVDMNKEIKDQILNLPKYFGDFDIIAKLKGEIKNPRALKALDDLESIFGILDDYDVSKYVSIDLGMIPSLNYYTGIIIKGYTYGVGFPLLTGGRYDNLYENFGSDMGAVGFSVGVNFLMMALTRQNIETEKYRIDTLVSCAKENIKTASKISDSLRSQGLIVEFDLMPSTKEHAVYYAKEKGIMGLLYVNKDKEIVIINLQTNEESKTTIDDLMGYGGVEG